MEAARVRIKEAIHQRLEGAAPFPPSPLMVRLEDAGPELLAALGGKAGNLARAKNQLDLPVPDGAVATLSAYKLFMEQELPGGGGTLLSRLKSGLHNLDLENEARVGASFPGVTGPDPGPADSSGTRRRPHPGSPAPGPGRGP